MTTSKETQAVPFLPLTAPPVIAPPNIKQTARKNVRYQKKKLALREQLWPNLSQDVLWDRNSHDGYTTVPRTLPIIFQIMDELADKGRPISSTYFALWARVFDESFIEIKSSDDLAFESGFSGQRAVSTWKQRMKKLVELKFIDAKSGGANQFSYVLIFNPYKIIKASHESKNIQEGKYNALFARALEVGANDLT